MSGWGQGRGGGHHHGQGNQGGQGWGNQPNQGGQGWGNQPNQGGQGWGNQPNQPNQGWNNQGNQGGMGPQGWGGNQGFNQNSSIFNANQDYLMITGIDKGKVADVSQGNDKNRLIIWSTNKDKNQRFRFIPSGNGKYVIQNGAGGCIQIPNGSGANGVQAVAGPQYNAPG
jgi:hypothetical protein